MDKDDKGCQPPEGPILCANDCGFFGNATTMNLCSQCYRAIVSSQAEAANAELADAATISPEQPKAETERQPRPEVVIPDAGTSNQSSETDQSPKEALASASQQPNRCFTCKKRVGLAGFKCRCRNVFCTLHRHHDTHDCPFDYRAAAQEAISKANPVVKADKMDKI